MAVEVDLAAHSNKTLVLGATGMLGHHTLLKKYSTGTRWVYMPLAVAVTGYPVVQTGAC